MKNTYECRVRARCPVDPTVLDVYDFTIESALMIQVEDIVEFFATHAGDCYAVFQEALTLQCAEVLRARVTSVGWHSGVKATCVAP